MRLLLTFPRLAFALVLVSIVGLCVAQQSIGFLLVAGTLAALSWYITEGPRGRTLPRWVSNILVMAVTLNLFVDLLQDRTDAISALGRFTVWLTLIKLYQRKTANDHAQLLLLSLLLMLTGCLQSVDLLFSIVLLIFTVLGVYVLMLYQLHAGYERTRDARQRATPPDDHLAPAMRPTVGRHAAGHFRTLVGGIGLLGVVLSAFVFAIFPREVGRGVVGDLPGPSAPRQVGFAEEIDLMRGGRITQSRDEALTVTIRDEDGRSKRADGPLLLRGAVLDRYIGHGVWIPTDGQILHLEAGPRADHWIVSIADKPETVTQEVVYRRWDDVLFSIATPVAIRTDPPVQLKYDRMSQTLRQAGPKPVKTYTVRSATALPPRVAAQLVEAPRPGTDDQQFDHPQVHVLAIRILRDTGLPWIPPRESEARWRWNLATATAFRDHLQQNGYQYTLDLGGVVARVDDGEFDPIVQFLTETRRGHCEYFASGFAALCHSVGVPARIVTGFLAYHYDEVDECYHVLESNAHAWAEVRTGPHEWTAFDASPAAVVRELHEVESTFADRLRWAYQRLEDAWTGAVVRFDRESQRGMLDSLDRDWSGRFAGAVRRIGAWMERVNQAFRLGPAGYIWMGIVGFAIVIAVVAVVKLARRSLAIRRTLRLQDLEAAEARRMLRQLGFYLDMLHVLERAGLAKPASRPPLAHAADLDDRHPGAAALVRTLTGLFYSARFGGRPLTVAGVSEARAAVDQLATTLEVRL